jgi:hypothetical protein
MLDQVSEYVKALGSYGNTFAIAPQEVIRRIQTERLE